VVMFVSLVFQVRIGKKQGKKQKKEKKLIANYVYILC